MATLSALNKAVVAACLTAVTMGVSLDTHAENATSSTHITGKFEYWPGTQYSQQIPTTEAVLGYQIGERISRHSDMVKYFEALAKAAPDRIKLFNYAETWEGRTLIYAVIGSK